MLSQNEYIQLCQTLALSSMSKSVIDEIRRSPPSRRVIGRAGNVCVRYPSRKMGVIIQAESHRNELAGIYEKEYDSKTLEYYDQPPPIKLIYQAKSGRQVGVWHTPDYFVIRTDGVGWEEWKMEQELFQLLEKMPHRYVRAEDHRWHCPPGQQYAQQYGFFYRIRSSAEIDWIFQRNMLFLEDYLRSDCLCVGEETAQKVSTLIAENPGMKLKEILAYANGDDIYTMIVVGRLYVDMHATSLAEPERVRIFLNKEMARAYSLITETSSAVPACNYVAVGVGVTVIWDDRQWTIVNLGKTKTTLLSANGELLELPNSTADSLVKQGKFKNFNEQAQSSSNGMVQELFSKTSPDDFGVANRRYAIIVPCLQGCVPKEVNQPSRTVRRWLKKWRDAEHAYGCGYIGLLPQAQEKGNRKRKLP